MPAEKKFVGQYEIVIASKTSHSFKGVAESLLICGLRGLVESGPSHWIATPDRAIANALERDWDFPRARRSGSRGAATIRRIASWVGKNSALAKLSRPTVGGELRPAFRRGDFCETGSWLLAQLYGKPIGLSRTQGDNPRCCCDDSPRAADPRLPPIGPSSNTSIFSQPWAESSRKAELL